MGPLISLFSKKKLLIVALKTNKDLGYMNELFEAGKIKSFIHGPFPLNELPEAIKMFGKGEHRGKVVMTV
jgi:NADPH:quinone reductase-like Zn-dependent oxidoreductase